MIRKKVTVISFLVCVLALSSVSLLYSQGQQAQSDKEQATVVQEGVMTERQREHSRLFKGYGTGKKLKDVGAEVPTGVLVKRGPGMPVGEDGPPQSLAGFLEGLACNADAVIVGVVKNKASQLTEDGEFAFTDYDLTVEQVIKDNKLSHLEPNVLLTVTRPGGRIQLSGHIIEAEDASFKPLTKGQRYILFLKFIPQTGAYTSLNSMSTYGLGQNSIRIETEEAVRSDLQKETPSTFQTKISAAVGDCQNAPKGGKS
jgi:hypothetical protein